MRRTDLRPVPARRWRLLVALGLPPVLHLPHPAGPAAVVLPAGPPDLLQSGLREVSGSVGVLACKISS